MGEISSVSVADFYRREKLSRWTLKIAS